MQGACSVIRPVVCWLRATTTRPAFPGALNGPVDHPVEYCVGGLDATNAWQYNSSKVQQRLVIMGKSLGNLPTLVYRVHWEPD